MLTISREHKEFIFSKEGIASILLSSFFCKEQLLYFFNMLGLLLLRKNTPYDTIIVYAAYYFCILLFIYYCVRNCSVRTIWLFIAGGVFLGGTVLIYRENLQYISEYGSRIFMEFMFPIIVLQQIRSRDHIVGSIRFGTLISGICMLIAYPMNEIVLKNHTAIDGYMVLTYMILVGFAGFIYFGITERRKAYIAIAIILFLEMVVAGSRGPLVCGIVITLIALRRSYNHLSRRSLLAITCVVMVAFGVTYNLDRVLLSLQKLVNQYQINARILDLISAGKFMNNESVDIRNNVFEYMGDYIKSNPFGYGFLGDRVILANINASYPHNFFYEIVLQFGWIIGGLVSIYIVYKLIRHLVFSTGKSVFESPIDITFAIGFVKLLMSGSYIWESLFAIMIYLIIAERKYYCYDREEL